MTGLWLSTQFNNFTRFVGCVYLVKYWTNQWHKQYLHLWQVFYMQRHGLLIKATTQRENFFPSCCIPLTCCNSVIRGQVTFNYWIWIILKSSTNNCRKTLFVYREASNSGHDHVLLEQWMIHVRHGNFHHKINVGTSIGGGYLLFQLLQDKSEKISKAATGSLYDYFLLIILGNENHFLRTDSELSFVCTWYLAWISAGCLNLEVKSTHVYHKA